MAENITIGITATGQAEVGKQISDAAGKVQQSTSGMANLIQKANQYFQQTLQASEIQEQKRTQHHRKELERIDKEIQARKNLVRELENTKGTDRQVAENQIRTLREEQAISSLEQQGQSLQTPQAKKHRIPGAGMLKGKVMRYGGAIAGLLGAYSLMTRIGGGMSSTEGVRDELAGSMMTMPISQRGEGFEKVSDGLIDVEKMLSEVGQTAFITAKDMRNMVAALRETSDVSHESQLIQAMIANEAKKMKVDPAVAGKIEQDMLRFGGINSPSEYLSMQRRIGGREGMSNRVEEMLQTQAETMMALSHGATQTGGRTIENILNLLDQSGMKMFSGQKGGQLLQRIDQGFRGGGNDQFEQFAYLGLSPMKQKKVGPMAGGFGGGMYDAYAADWIQEQGAFATKETLIKQARAIGNEDLADYLEKTLSSDGLTSFEKVVAKVKSGLDIQKGGGGKLRLASELGGQNGMMSGASSTDIQALLSVLGGRKRDEFVKLMAAGKIKEAGDLSGVAPEFLKGQAEGHVGGKSAIERGFDKLGKDLNKIIEKNRKVMAELIDFVGKGTEALGTLNDFLHDWFGGKKTEGLDPKTDKALNKYLSTLDPKFLSSMVGKVTAIKGAEAALYGDVHWVGESPAGPEEQAINFRRWVSKRNGTENAGYGHGMASVLAEVGPALEKLVSFLTGGEIEVKQVKVGEKSNLPL